MAIGPDGTLYFVDNGNFRIRAVDPATGIITTVAGNRAAAGSKTVPTATATRPPALRSATCFSIAMDRQRNTLYLPAISLSRVRKVNLATGIIENFAGIGVFAPSPSAQDGDGVPATSGWFGSVPWRRRRRGQRCFHHGLLRTLRRVDGATGIINRIAGLDDPPGVPIYLTAATAVRPRGLV